MTFASIHANREEFYQEHAYLFPPFSIVRRLLMSSILGIEKERKALSKNRKKSNGSPEEKKVEIRQRLFFFKKNTLKRNLHGLYIKGQNEMQRLANLLLRADCVRSRKSKIRVPLILSA